MSLPASASAAASAASAPASVRPHSRASLSSSTSSSSSSSSHSSDSAHFHRSGDPRKRSHPSSSSSSSHHWSADAHLLGGVEAPPSKLPRSHKYDRPHIELVEEASPHRPEPAPSAAPEAPLSAPSPEKETTAAAPPSPAPMPETETAVIVHQRSSRRQDSEGSGAAAFAAGDPTCLLYPRVDLSHIPPTPSVDEELELDVLWQRCGYGSLRDLHPATAEMPFTVGAGSRRTLRRQADAIRRLEEGKRRVGEGRNGQPTRQQRGQWLWQRFTRVKTRARGRQRCAHPPHSHRFTAPPQRRPSLTAWPSAPPLCCVRCLCGGEWCWRSGWSARSRRSSPPWTRCGRRTTQGPMR